MNVLLVEDQPADAKLVELALRQDAPETTVLRRAGRISEALSRLRESPTDAVLLDLGLPDATGLDGLRAILPAAPDAAVVVLSGSEDPELVRAAIDLGAQGYEVKGIFPRGYLGQVLRDAVAIGHARTRLAGAEPLEPDELRTLDEVSEGVVVADRAAPIYANPASRRILDWSVPLPGELPALLRTIVEAEAQTWPPRGSGRSPPRSTRLGEGIVHATDGHRSSVQYFLHVIPGTHGVRLMIRVRHSNRSLRGTGSPAGPEPPRAPGVPTSEPAPPRSEEVLDPQVWSDLRALAGDDPTFVPNLVQTFGTYGEELLAELAAAEVRGDLGAMQRAAHTFKTSSAQVGALRLANLLRDAERHCLANEADAAKSAVASARVEFRAVVAALRNPP